MDFRKALLLEQGMIGDDKEFFREFEGLREVEGHLSLSDRYEAKV